MTKECTICEEEKEEEEFNWRNKKLQQRQPACRICTRKQVKRHYNKHPSYYKAKAKKRSRIVREENRLKIVEYLSCHPCVDCEEDDPMVLQFDHIGFKILDVSRMICDAYSWQKISEEIEKCEIRCGNCHFRKTAKERGYFKSYLL